MQELGLPEATARYQMQRALEDEMDKKALLNVKEMCEYLGIVQTKTRELLANLKNNFTIIPNDTLKWLKNSRFYGSINGILGQYKGVKP